MNRTRCRWCNINNPLYIDYHDKEWGKRCADDKKLYEMLILESFQAGLSWECVLNKRDAFRKAFDGFEAETVSFYDEKKIALLMEDNSIIRNRLKINAAVVNSKAFLLIVKEYGSFYTYLKSFTGDNVIYENDKTQSELSDLISRDLKKRGMKFVGSTIIYSFLQATGFINSHENSCFLYMK